MNPSRLVLLGDPVAQSLSPRFQSAAIAAAGLTVSYEAMQVSAHDLPRVARELAAERAGGNVTIPHKAAMLALCAEVTPVAQQIGAVNTFWVEGGKLFGDNTDVGGFDKAARNVLGSVDRRSVALIGAGGAAAAVLGAVGSWPGATVRIFSRRLKSAADLAARFGDFVRAESSAAAALHGAMLVVNATPVGMSDGTLPFPIADLTPRAVIIDLVYGKRGTPLTRAAAEAGFVASDGTDMLVEQGALSFERWFGFAPNRTVMRTALA